MASRSRWLLAGSIAVVLISVVMVRGGNSVSAADALLVSLPEPINSARYPILEATVSAVDSESGRPAPEIDTSGIAISDESGRLEVVAVTPGTSYETPVAFSILLDTGGAMAPHVDRARKLVEELVSRLGPNDLVRIVKFNEGTDVQGTNWVRRDDPNLAAQIASWHATNQLSLVVPALIRASEVARLAPQGYERHVTVAFVSVDGARGEPGLTLDSVTRIPTVTFTFGFGTPTIDREDLTQFLQDLATQRSGAYWPVDSTAYTGNEPSLLLDAAHAVWKLSFRADGLPDGQSHKFSLEVRDRLQRSGTVAGSYTSGRLLAVSPLQVTGLQNADRVTGDREVAIMLGGEKQWLDWKIQLFRDCQPDICSPIAETKDRALDWRLIAGPIEQGEHVLHIRLVASDGNREFTDTHVLRFTRAGTGWNFFTPIAFLGIAIAGGGIAVALARRARQSASGALGPLAEPTQFE